MWRAYRGMIGKEDGVACLEGLVKFCTAATSLIRVASGSIGARSYQNLCRCVSARIYMLTILIRQRFRTATMQTDIFQGCRSSPIFSLKQHVCVKVYRSCSTLRFRTDVVSYGYQLRVKYEAADTAYSCDST